MSFMARLVSARLAQAPAPAPRPKPKPEPELPTVAELFSRPPPRPVEPPPLPVLKPGWRGNCQAVNAATGRRCGLLHGHEGNHVHGRTAFTAIALTDEDVARARARLDERAQRRGFNPFSNPAAGGTSLE